jgi:hypothetical protein
MHEFTADGPDLLPKGCCGAAVENELTGNAVKYIFELHCDPKDCGPTNENSECANSHPQYQKFTSGVVSTPLLENGEKCLFSEQCEMCCCNTKGQGPAAQTCVNPGSTIATGNKCCPYALYTSTFPFGEDCPE